MSISKTRIKVDDLTFNSIKEATEYLNFKPYEINKDQEISCIHAVWNDSRQIDMLPSCVNSTFNYFSQNWYTEILEDLQKGQKSAWARPYRSTQLGNLMMTVGSGIYDQNRPVVRDFVNGYEPRILLDFNVDGNILDNI